jgi:hypothetical protein
MRRMRGYKPRTRSLGRYPGPNVTLAFPRKREVPQFRETPAQRAVLSRPR